ncbi:unnamed protein product [Protopolystoma xenopodis]|uniref:Uncharacterized protein n=1 Tax=Protopolystoma xenopodis TaxID=117903 RepID=A0A3S4ZF41_9PLAT|nr:unnamed protein product [Protopolystoma xenopodis]
MSNMATNSTVSGGMTSGSGVSAPVTPGGSGRFTNGWMWPDVAQMDSLEAREVLDRILSESKSKTRRAKELAAAQAAAAAVVATVGGGANNNCVLPASSSPTSGHMGHFNAHQLPSHVLGQTSASSGGATSIGSNGSGSAGGGTLMELFDSGSAANSNSCHNSPFHRPYTVVSGGLATPNSGARMVLGAGGANGSSHMMNGSCASNGSSPMGPSQFNLSVTSAQRSSPSGYSGAAFSGAFDLVTSSDLFLASPSSPSASNGSSTLHLSSGDNPSGALSSGRASCLLNCFSRPIASIANAAGSVGATVGGTNGTSNGGANANNTSSGSSPHGTITSSGSMGTQSHSGFMRRHSDWLSPSGAGLDGLLQQSGLSRQHTQQQSLVLNNQVQSGIGGIFGPSTIETDLNLHSYTGNLNSQSTGLELIQALDKLCLAGGLESAPSSLSTTMPSVVSAITSGSLCQSGLGPSPHCSSSSSSLPDRGIPSPQSASLSSHSSFPLAHSQRPHQFAEVSEEAAEFLLRLNSQVTSEACELSAVTTTTATNNDVGELRFPPGFEDHHKPMSSLAKHQHHHLSTSGYSDSGFAWGNESGFGGFGGAQESSLNAHDKPSCDPTGDLFQVRQAYHCSISTVSCNSL